MRHLLSRDSPHAAVVGLALAAIVANVLALGFTVVFARILGTDGYGALAACLSAFLIFAVAGSALQVAAARDVAAGHHGTGPELAATVRRWMTSVAAAGAVLLLLAVLLRVPIATVIGVPEAPWAAALTVPAATAWIALCVLRGALQGDGQFAVVGWSIIGEAVGRLAAGLVLVALGLGVTGAFLGTPLSMLVAAAVLLRRLGPAGQKTAGGGLRRLAAGAWAPIAALAVLVFLQNVDVLVVKHRLDDDAAGAYAAAAVAAKLLIWVAIGVSGYVVAESSRRAAAGDPALGPLKLTLTVIAALAVPVGLLFAVAPALLLELAFGEEFASAADALLPLGMAMTLLAATYLAAQYLLALHRTGFLAVLAAAAAVEVVALTLVGDGIVAVAVAVLGVMAAAAIGVLVAAARATPAPRIVRPAIEVPAVPGSAAAAVVVAVETDG